MNLKVVIKIFFGSLVPLWHCSFGWADELNDKVEHVRFNEDVIFSKYKNAINLKRFEKNEIIPGLYYMDIYVNEEKIGYFDVDVRDMEGKIIPCLTTEIIFNIGLKESVLSSIKEKIDNSNMCFDITKFLSGSKFRINSSDQNIYLSIPQIYMDTNPRGFVSPKLLSNGMNSAFLNYNLSAYDSQFENNNTKSSFFSVNSGINLWGWFFRHNGNYSYYNDKYNSKHSYHNMNTYLLKDIFSLSSKLIIGQSNTSGRVFDSINYTGISLSSDDAMLPESLRGFAPVVRGIAQTNARVTIRQKNSIIYETTVPPGEFVIRDLFPTSYGGDLQVVVREANGFESSFIIPFASVVDMLRPNAYKYEVVAGSYRNENIKDGQPFYQLTYQRGLSNFMTLYGGSQQSDYYGSYLLGSAFNFPFGAFAVDVTHSGTHGLEDNLTGQSYRLSFNKRINKTHSDITLVGYKLSTENYLDFDNAMLYQEQLKNGYTLSTDSFLRPKNRYTLSLNQNLGAEYGQLYISGLYENYWNSSHTGKQIQFGYSNAWRRLFYSLNVSRYSNQFNDNDYSYMLTLNIPLGKETKGALTSSLGRNTSGDWYEQLMLSGSSGKNNRLGWSVTTNKTEGELLNATLSGNYTSPFTTLVGSSSVNGDARTISAGASGAIVAHPLGVTFSPYSSNGYIIAHAEQAKGVEISSYPHLKLDFLGNAAIPVGSPYQKNTVSLDPKNLSNNIELKSSSKDVYPRSGAVVLAEFDTKVGYPLLLKPIHSPSIALGTNVYDGNMNIVGQVGQGGLIYIHPSTVQGILTVSNSSAQESICTIKYDIHDQIKIDSTSSLYISNYSCE